MRRRPDQLATGEWAVLALVAEGPTHGFAIARALAPGGEVGRVWAMRRPLVYRTLDVLAERELVQEVGTEPSGSGPPRTVFDVTADGRARVDAWRLEPVWHVRDARAELMLKLLFLDRSGVDPAPLLTAQRERLGAIARELEDARDEGFARTLALWRLESTRAAIRFVDGLLSG
ncbi:PadR family transcriptional regulator [Solirubrobacter sp. CPCC 204708]|uniref:PadR family transcriptional regulator n=1 Tax=Solirubrobacter deserti TaxID=2282478 RepID=A0ABT4RIV1_9ACTN|nr:PadR family transcriptional regulator [Solirubrobacter deserti]MBE2320803.1 PadR family transcriptional regulator [Solirubrobacter deserti]MDA0138438.1 PadR family transcriptional regulator [Solirubrobacter deserti]